MGTVYGNQLRAQILLMLPLPKSWADQWSQWIDRDEIVEKQTAEETLQNSKTIYSEI